VIRIDVLTIFPRLFDSFLAETFVAIARSGSFTDASRRLARSQPAISRRIHQLEQSLGVALFERTGRRARLSAAGDALLPHAEAALAAAADGARAVEAARSGTSPARLRLAVVGTLADSHLVEALRALEARHPRSRVEVATASSREVTALVRAGAADLGAGRRAAHRRCGDRRGLHGPFLRARARRSRLVARGGPFLGRLQRAPARRARPARPAGRQLPSARLRN